MDKLTKHECALDDIALEEYRTWHADENDIVRITYLPDYSLSDASTREWLFSLHTIELEERRPSTGQIVIHDYIVENGYTIVYTGRSFRECWNWLKKEHDIITEQDKRDMRLEEYRTW